MVGNFLTRQGYKMNPVLRQKIIAAMAERRGQTLAQIGKAVGVNRRTVSDYLTDETYDEVARYEGPPEVGIDHVDAAMLALACKGNVPAARLVYMRMAQKGEIGPMPSLSDMEQELMKLKQLEETRDGATTNDADAVDTHAAG